MSGENLAPGAIFGRDFRVVRALRAGGMGAVYIVDQLSTGRRRALKVLAPQLATDPATRERFVLEARAASRIESDHVVEVVTAGIDDVTLAPFLVMELLRGEELADALERTGPLPLGDVAEILSQVGHALEQAHAQGIVHRDLKPENIFLAVSRRREATFTVKILDFGIAKMVADSAKTAGTQPLGTPLFMSPEQTDRKGRICPATDVWALGLIAFRLLTGLDFWQATDGSLTALLREIVVDELPYASVRAQEHGVAELLPPGFDAWFARCVNRDIDARFQEAGEAVRAFAELVTSDAVSGKLIVQVPRDSGLSLLSPEPSGTGRVSVEPVDVNNLGSGDLVTVGLAQEGAAAPTGLAAVISASETGSPIRAADGGPAQERPWWKRVPLALAVGLPVLAVAGALALAFTAARSGAKGETAPQSSAGPGAGSSAGASSASAASSGTRCADGMVLIKGGTAFLGADDLKDAAPSHQVTLSSFCLDKMEVTTAAYLRCSEGQRCPRPLDHVDSPGIKESLKADYSVFCNARASQKHGDHPINCVSWFMASAYCEAQKLRLPTEAEWEFAARGSDQRRFPWGDDPPSAGHLNACGAECLEWSVAHGNGTMKMYDGSDGFLGTAPAGSFPAGASAAGVLDMAGNVWEWTADFYGPYDEAKMVNPKGPQGLDTNIAPRVMRGGGFLGQDPSWAKPAYRYRMAPKAFNHAIGFRCAGEPQ